VAIGVVGFFALRRASKEGTARTTKYNSLAQSIRQRAVQLQTNPPIDPALRTKAELLDAIEHYKDQAAKFKAVQADYDKLRRQKQLDMFLSGYLIRAAAIPKVTSSDIAAMASFGITTAYDAKQRDVLQVYGIGPVKEKNLGTWVTSVEAKFRFQNPYSQEDQRSIRKTQNEIISKQQGLDEKIKKLVDQLRTHARTYESWRTSKDPDLARLCTELAQVAADMNYLGLTVPPAPAVPPSPVVSPNYRTGALNLTATAANSTSGRGPALGMPRCPVCSGSMVLRMARRGSRRGKTFWGCSRYPTCTGTRN
jgi:hypothetical protein